MSSVPEVLKAEYYFDMDLMEYHDVFEGASFVWEVVKNMQGKVVVDKLTRTRCEAVIQAEQNTAAVLGTVDVRIGSGAKVGPNVTISGDGGAVSIDAGAEILPGNSDYRW